MRDATNLTIRELIIHILDPQGQGLILSNIAVPLENSPALVDYFCNHIQTSLKDPGIKSTRFRNINPEQPSGICRGILRGDIPLVEGSHRLAQELYVILERDRRITSGDMALCLFQAENYPYTRFLGIMKVDPAQIFHHVILQNKRGDTYVSFETLSQAFTSERLQKCAFIQPLEPRHPEFDMLLLDRQQRIAENGSIARFFSETFLDAEEAYDARKMTGIVYRGLVNAENRVRQRLPRAQCFARPVPLLGMMLKLNGSRGNGLSPFSAALAKLGRPLDEEAPRALLCWQAPLLGVAARGLPEVGHCLGHLPLKGLPPHHVGEAVAERGGRLLEAHRKEEGVQPDQMPGLDQRRDEQFALLPREAPFALRQTPGQLVERDRLVWVEVGRGRARGPGPGGRGAPRPPRAPRAPPRAPAAGPRAGRAGRPPAPCGGRRGRRRRRRSRPAG